MSFYLNYIILINVEIKQGTQEIQFAFLILNPNHLLITLYKNASYQNSLSWKNAVNALKKRFLKNAAYYRDLIVT